MATKKPPFEMESAASPASKSPPKFKIPKAIGACADRLFTVRQQRLDAQKIVDAFQVEETALKDYIIDTLPKSESTGAAGKLARVSVVVKEVPQVKDWDAFYAYVHKNKAYDLLNRALTKASVEARWEAGKEVPGVDHVKVVTVSMNKV